MKKVCAFLFAVAILNFGPSANAQVGWTLDQCKAAYGQPTSHTPPSASDDADVYVFETGGYYLHCRLWDNKVTEIDYSRLDDRPLSKKEVKEILEKNSAGAKWTGPKKYDHGDNRPGLQYTTVGATRGHGLIAFYTLKWGDLKISGL